MFKRINRLFRNKRFRLPKKRIILVLALVICIIAAGGFYLKNHQTRVAMDIPGWSWILGGRIITIDPGHGGVDPGAVGLQKTLEKDINLEVSKRLQALFVQAGSNVTMLREDDRDFGTSSKLLQRKREDLAYRIEKAMESHADIYLSIHANSFPDHRQSGAQVFYHPDSEEGKKLAKSIQDSLNKVASKKREAKSNQDYYVLKNTDMVAVTIEVGFLSNPEEESLLNRKDYQLRLAMAIFEGVANYLMEEKPIISND